MNNQSHTDQHNQTWVLPMLLLWLMVDVRKPSILTSFTVIITYHKPLTRVLSSSTWSDLGTANATTEVDVRKHRRTSSRSNSAGTSDDEVVKESPKKMINMMIGSFWEGWGVNTLKMMIMIMVDLNCDHSGLCHGLQCLQYYWWW